MKKIILSAIVLSFTVIGAHAQKSATFVADGKAIKGYDPVAFFTESRAVRGQDSLMYGWNGADWLFSSRANLDRFRAEPEKYAPQYGGYCAYGTSQGHKAPTQVDTWSVVDGKLYFNYSMKVKEMWMKDRAGFIMKADQQWPALKDKE
jgi:YHS domain-containing protein